MDIEDGRQKYWSDLGSPSVAWMSKRAVFASEEGWMPFENEAKILCFLL
jgi:hypothetical protein